MVLLDKNLMGFRPSPYNSVKMYLITEEVIRGDRHDESNPFQWDKVVLNLPGTPDYIPSKPWAYKVQRDGSIASNFVSFMDDQRLVRLENRGSMKPGMPLARERAIWAFRMR